MVMVGIFIPFFQQEAHQLGLTAFFSNIFQFGTQVTINSYIAFLKRLSYHHHDNVPLDKKALIELIVEAIVYFNLLDQSTLTQQKQEEYTYILYKELFEQHIAPPAMSPQQQLPHNHHHHGKHGHHSNPYPSPKNQG